MAAGVTDRTWTWKDLISNSMTHYPITAVCGDTEHVLQPLLTCGPAAKLHLGRKSARVYAPQELEHRSCSVRDDGTLLPRWSGRALIGVSDSNEVLVGTILDAQRKT